MKRLAAQVKLEAVLEVVEGKRSLIEVSKKYGCSRQSLAVWLARYKKAQGVRKVRDVRKEASEALESAYRRGASHPRSLAPRVERLVLEMVIKLPELNIRDLSLELARAGVKISTAAVYKILVRHNLQVRELRHAFSFAHPAGTLYASRISPAYRKKLIEEYLFGKFSIAEICRRWSVSRRTFYLWLKRYQEAAVLTPGESRPTPGVFEQELVDALAKRYRRGFEHQRSIGNRARQAILDIVRQNPYYSVHKIYEIVKKLQNLASVGHQAIQNLLSRENLNTLAKRLQYAAGFIVEPIVQVAPLYRPEMPVYRWRDLFAPFVTIPKLLVTDPRKGLSALSVLSIPFLAVFFFIRTVSSAAPGTSVVGLAFASVALLFGLFFFVYSMKYYISIFMVLRVAQSGSGSQTTNN